MSIKHTTVSGWILDGAKLILRGTAEVQRKITLLSLYDFLYMCFVLILYLFEKT